MIEPRLFQVCIRLCFLASLCSGGIGHLCNSVMLPASSLVHGCFNSGQAVAAPVFLPKLNTGLRMSQCEMLQAEPQTPSLVTSFRSRDPLHFENVRFSSSIFFPG